MESISIHPGVIGGRRQHPLMSNTKPVKKKNGKLAKKLKWLNARQIDREQTIKQPRVNAVAFKPPGSMNQHK